MFEFPDERHVVTYYVIHFEPLYPNNGFFISKFLGAYVVVRFPRVQLTGKFLGAFVAARFPRQTALQDTKYGRKSVIV